MNWPDEKVNKSDERMHGHRSDEKHYWRRGSIGRMRGSIGWMKECMGRIELCLTCLTMNFELLYPSFSVIRPGRWRSELHSTCSPGSVRLPRLRIWPRCRRCRGIPKRRPLPMGPSPLHLARRDLPHFPTEAGPLRKEIWLFWRI